MNQLSESIEIIEAGGKKGLRFTDPSGRNFEVTPGNLDRDPGRAAHEIARWATMCQRAESLELEPVAG